MKKILSCLTLALFAAVTSVQAGETAAPAKTTEKAQACATEAKGGCCEKSVCSSSSKKISAKKAHSMKGATLLALR
jgi:hypothetical protein